MQVTLWNDYICPWAYAARPLTDWLVSEGHEISVRSYELHPDLAPEGKQVKPGGRLDRVFDHIATECAQVGLEFNKPSRSPNTHQLLGICELVSTHAPGSFAVFDAELAASHWVRNEALDDDAVVRRALDRADAPVDDILEMAADGEGSRLLEQSMHDAWDLDVTGTPAWRIGSLTITGLHPPEQFERWVHKLAAKAATSEAESSSP